jgi:hypothetical protein
VEDKMVHYHKKRLVATLLEEDKQALPAKLAEEDLPVTVRKAKMGPIVRKTRMKIKMVADNDDPLSHPSGEFFRLTVNFS